MQNTLTHKMFICIQHTHRQLLTFNFCSRQNRMKYCCCQLNFNQAPTGAFATWYIMEILLVTYGASNTFVETLVNFLLQNQQCKFELHHFLSFLFLKLKKQCEFFNQISTKMLFSSIPTGCAYFSTSKCCAPDYYLVGFERGLLKGVFNHPNWQLQVHKHTREHVSYRHLGQRRRRSN
jgi:hypothetical protein